MKAVIVIFCTIFSCFGEMLFVLFTQPKTGTHLLIPILETFTKKKVYWAPEFTGGPEFFVRPVLDLTNPNLFYFSTDKNPWTREQMDQVWRTNEMQGKFLHLHAPYSPVVENYLTEKRCVNFFLKRDPRDQIVSLLNHYKKFGLQDLSLESCASDDEMLLGTIRNSLRKITLSFMGWLTSPVSCVLDFSKLMGTHGGEATDFDSLGEMRKIASALGLDVADSYLRSVYRAHFGHGWNFFRGKIGSWKDYFKEEHKIAVKEEIGDLLIELGYEQNLDW